MKFAMRLNASVVGSVPFIFFVSDRLSCAPSLIGVENVDIFSKHYFWYGRRNGQGTIDSFGARLAPFITFLLSV